MNKRGKLVKINADSTNKQFMLFILFTAFCLLVVLNLVATFSIPNVLYKIRGLKECPEDYSTFRGFCHKLTF